MNYTKNQSGESIIAVGTKDSPVRIKDEFNITIPKLIDLLTKNWERGGLERHTDAQELYEIMEKDYIIDKDVKSKLFKTAYFYFNESLSKKPLN